MAELATTLAATEDERLEQAEALVRGFCGWHIAPERSGETVTLRGECRQVLLLPSLYVTAVASVVVDGVTMTVEDDYTWTTSGVLRRSGRYASWGRDEVTVSFTHGYDDIPPEVTAIVQAVAQRAVDNPGSRQREQVGPFSADNSRSGNNESATLALLESEKAALAAYRLPTLA